MSVYPGAIDTFQSKDNLPGETYDSTDHVTVWAENFNDLNDAVVAVEDTLGINPQDTYADVASRLDALKAAIDAIPSQTDILEATYPVGSYYFNETNPTNPATLLGFGTWVAVTDKFLVGHGSTYTGAGGAATHTHPLSSNGGAQMAQTVASKKTYYNQSGPTTSWTDQSYSVAASAAGDSTVINNSVALIGNTDSASNIPPYQAVYIWKRTV